MSATLVVDGLDFPTSLALTGDGLFVAESGLPFASAPGGGRVWQVTADGGRSMLIDGLRAPVNGLAACPGGLVVSEGGHPGRIGVLEGDGEYRAVVDNLPGPGNYHTNMIAVGPDGWWYFSQGAMTNMGVVGLDSYEIGWLKRLPHAHDIPAVAVTVSSQSAETPDPFASDPGARTRTAGFAPFGTARQTAARLEGSTPATAAVMRVRPDGSGLEVVAWGLRNAWALGFHPDGRLLAIDQGADDRGSRPVANAPDVLFEVKAGAWYGWPDFIAGEPVTSPRFLPTRGPRPEFLLTDHSELPPPERPLVEFEPHVAAVKFDVLPEGTPQAGTLLVALFGDEAPMTRAPGPKRGRHVARVDLASGSVTRVDIGVDLARPIDVKVDAAGACAYVLDFGEFEMTDRGVNATRRTGRIWRVPLDHFY